MNTLICNYCGHMWKEALLLGAVKLQCAVCNDKNIKIVKKSNVFGYEEPELELEDYDGGD